MESGQSSLHPSFPVLQSGCGKKGKVVSAEEAVRVIKNGDTVATGGFVGIASVANEEKLIGCRHRSTVSIRFQFRLICPQR